MSVFDDPASLRGQSFGYGLAPLDPVAEDSEIFVETRRLGLFIDEQGMGHVSGPLRLYASTDPIDCERVPTFSKDNLFIRGVYESIYRDVVPTTDGTLNLGNVSRPWKSVYAKEFVSDSIALSGNLIFKGAKITDKFAILYALGAFGPALQLYQGGVEKFQVNEKGVDVYGNLTTNSINDGPLAGFRNRIINGNFDIWQRGTSQTLSTTSDTSYYVADRWLNYFNGTGGVRTVSRQTFTNGQTDVPGNPAYFFRFGQTTAPTGCTLNAITQRIESVRTFAGQQFTFSFWAKAASAFTLPEISIGQDFGNGGSPSPQTYTTFLNISISTTWTKYTFTATLPSISGKTLGTDGNDHISVNWFCPTSSTFTLDIAQVQLERGPIATDFEQRPIGTELALCQRYFCKSYEINTAPGTSEFDRGNPNSLSPASLDSLPCNVSFPVTMRSSPSVTIYRPSTGDVGTVENSVQTGPITVANVETGSTGIGLLVLNANSPAVGISYQFQYTASAEI